MRNTSREAYDHLKKTGALSKLRLFVYGYMYNNGPLTMAEVRDNLNDTRTTYAPRLTELKEMGLIEIVGHKKCAKSGHVGEVLDVTDRMTPLPLKRIDRETRKQLEAKVEKYERALAMIDYWSTQSSYTHTRHDINKLHGFIADALKGMK